MVGMPFRADGRVLLRLNHAQSEIVPVVVVVDVLVVVGRPRGLVGRALVLVVPVGDHFEPVGVDGILDHHNRVVQHIVCPLVLAGGQLVAQPHQDLGAGAFAAVDGGDDPVDGLAPRHERLRLGIRCHLAGIGQLAEDALQVIHLRPVLRRRNHRQDHGPALFAMCRTRRRAHGPKCAPARGRIPRCPCAFPRPGSPWSATA